MSYKLELPDIGEGVVEAEIQQWFVEEGDVVAEDQPLVEVMTDKATVVIPSPKSGRIVKRFFEVGDVAKVHAPIVEMDLEAGGAPARKPEPARAPPRDVVEEEQPTAEAAATPAELRAASGAPAPRSPGQKSLATPAVRALARELSIDIDAVAGSGPGGRVTKDDLTAFRRATNGHGRPELRVAPPGPERKGASQAPPGSSRSPREGASQASPGSSASPREGASQAPPGSSASREGASQAPPGSPASREGASQASPGSPLSPREAGGEGRGEGGRADRGAERPLTLAPAGERVAGSARPSPQLPTADERIPLRGVRKRIAENMARSKRTAAHFTFVEQCDVSELVRVKDRIAAAARDDGVKVTFLPFVVKAVVAALRRFPKLNASVDDEKGELVLHHRYDIGIASATDAGLVVPVVRGADARSLVDLAREIERLSTDSKAGRARPEDMGRSTFTITSLGALGGMFATPVLNYPEVGILGIHRMRPTPVVRDGQIVVRDVMHVSITSDHRMVDGHEAAAFCYEVIRSLEDPNLLFMHMV